MSFDASNTVSLSGKKVLVVLRHENSLQIVQDFVAERGGEILPVALNPIEAPHGVAGALDALRTGIPAADMVVMGTKVFDTAKDGPSRLFELLLVLKSYGAGKKPICLTHLQTFPPETLQMFREIGLNLHWCENDNLKRDRMTNLGPIMLNALSRS